MAALDGMRGILALIVFVGHVQQIFITPFQDIPYDVPTQVGGWLALLAVVFFFCLSGYVIALSIAQNHRRHDGFAMAAYVRSRAWRVLPALIGVILITLALEKILQLFAAGDVPAGLHAARHTFALDWQSQLQCLTTVCFKGDLTGGIVGPLWTLAYEIQLYFLAGVGAFVVLSRAHPALRIAVLVAVVAALKGIILLEAASALNIRKVFFVCFALGFAAYLLRPLIGRSLAGCGRCRCWRRSPACPITSPGIRRTWRCTPTLGCWSP